MLAGIDVSNNNGTIDWGRVRQAGKEFAIVKASGGISFKDPYRISNVHGARAVGLEIGYYHFAFDTSPGPPEAEADNFISAIVDTILPGEVIALDIEMGSGDLSAWASRWMQRVENRSGIKPWLYSSPSFLNEHGLRVPALADNGLWLASWGLAGLPAAPSPWDVLACWQSGVGTCPGVTGACDLDVFNGSREQFRRYGSPVPTTEPGGDVVTVPRSTLADLYQRLQDASATIDDLLQ